LVGGAVNDVLVGGDRADRFEFDMSLSSSSIDIAWCGGGV
jgi:Ca2+-binding RTX toxin-like protein